MNPEDFRGSPTGKLLRLHEGYQAFVPNPLPASVPIDMESVTLLSEADAQVGRLAGFGNVHVLPNPHLLIEPYMRREAVLSSRIEGTQSSLSDLFFFEAAKQIRPQAPDVREVWNYVRALEHGLKRLRDLPLSLRLVRELHAQLMQGVRGEQQAPGEFRRIQHWIGPDRCSLADASFVPPPVPEMLAGLDDWEKFVHLREGIPPLVQCALMHYQFEAVHPFLDGNGRIGRLLITLFLCERGRLPQPLLYLSAYFERYQSEYYRRLLEVSKSGDWVGWIRFFLRGVAVQAGDAVECAERLLTLRERYIGWARERNAAGSVIRLLERLFLNPVTTAARAAEFLSVSVVTAQRAIEALVEAGILQEVTGRQRNRVYLAEELLRTIEGERMRRPRRFARRAEVAIGRRGRRDTSRGRGV